jgi:hypothetical protein
MRQAVPAATPPAAAALPADTPEAGMADPLKLTTEGVQPTPFRIPGSRGEFRIQILNEDAGRGVVTSIVHIPAGGFIPAHYHQAGA